MPYRAIAALAAVGVADTAYLSAVKLLHLQPACPLSGGCADVLTSEYANLFGVLPLSFVGLAAYAGMGALALAGARQAAAAAAAGGGAEAEQDAGPLRTAVLAGGLAMASCSSVLLYILFTRFAGELCPWCLGSAGLSFAIAAAAASGLRRRELEEAAGPGAGVVAATLLFMFTALGGVDGTAFAAGGYDLDYAMPVVTTSSPPRAVALAQVRCQPRRGRAWGCCYLCWSGRLACSSGHLLELLRSPLQLHVLPRSQRASPASAPTLPLLPAPAPAPNPLPTVSACAMAAPACTAPFGAATATTRSRALGRRPWRPSLTWSATQRACTRCAGGAHSMHSSAAGAGVPQAAASASRLPWPARVRCCVQRAPAGGRGGAAAVAASTPCMRHARSTPGLLRPAPEQDTQMAAACQEAPGGLTGFPTWVMPDGEQLVGEQTFEQLEAALDKALAATAAAAAAS